MILRSMRFHAVYLCCNAVKFEFGDSREFFQYDPRHLPFREVGGVMISQDHREQNNRPIFARAGSIVTPGSTIVEISGHSWGHCCNRRG